jgi:FtsZ-binding cell division protein ZapB
MNVSMHEHYREICAAASIGQATPEELFELEQHAAECEPCHQAYFEYLHLAAEQFAKANEEPVLSSRDAEEALNSELFTRRFFERAEREGIPFSEDVGEEVRQLTPKPKPVQRQVAWRVPLRAIAAVLLISMGLSTAYLYGRRSGQRSAEAKETKALQAVSPASSLNERIGELADTNAKLETEAKHLRTELAKTADQLRDTQRDLRSVSQDREGVEAARVSLEQQLRTVEEAVTQSKTMVETAQRESATNGARADEVESALVSYKIKVDELTSELKEKSAALDKERQLLALGHDVSNLMAERNLHIVDVADTDPAGKTQPAFGRIFFTEGKKLVFYAYDLNEAKLQKANYQYRVWAKQEGGEKRVRSLGIFYSDDKAQRRWVFKCNDPKILSVIDSVFVTLEPADSDPSNPKGQNLMYAYLRGQPNHP